MKNITFDIYEPMGRTTRAGRDEDLAQAAVDIVKASQSDVATTHDRKILELKTAHFKTKIIRWMLMLVFAHAGMVRALVKFAR